MLIYQIIVTFLLIALFGFTRKNLKDFKKPSLHLQLPRKEKPLVSICIPARDEEKNIRTLLRSIMNQSYTQLEILVLDDHSTDQTAEYVKHLSREDSRIKCIKGQDLQKGWSGKTFAMQQLGQMAQGEWILFCDADTKFSPICVETVLNQAQDQNLDGLSLFPLQTMETTGEKLTIPLIYFILTSYLPIKEVLNNPNPAFSAGCGQFLFARKTAFQEVGGFKQIQATLHDGPKFPGLLKKQGKRINLFDGQKLVSCRMYTSFKTAWNGLSRSFYSGINFPIFLLNIVWHFALFVLPAIFFIIGFICDKSSFTWTFLPMLQVVCGILIRTLQNQQFSLPLWPVLLTPVSFALFCALQIHSFCRHKIFKSVTWKGRQI